MRGLSVIADLPGVNSAYCGSRVNHRKTLLEDEGCDVAGAARMFMLARDGG